MKLFVALALLVIIASLGTAWFFMLRSSHDSDRQRSRRMAWALALRIALSIALFISLLAAWKLGYIQPHGLQVESSGN